jgi:hypothetical protein
MALSAQGSELLMMGRKAAETCRIVIPIKLEFSASVGFIHFNSLPSFIKMTEYSKIQLKLFSVFRLPSSV